MFIGRSTFTVAYPGKLKSKPSEHAKLICLLFFPSSFHGLKHRRKKKKKRCVFTAVVFALEEKLIVCDRGGKKNDLRSVEAKTNVELRAFLLRVGRDGTTLKSLQLKWSSDRQTFGFKVPLKLPSVLPSNSRHERRRVGATDEVRPCVSVGDLRQDV